MGKVFPVMFFVFWIPLGVAAMLGWRVGKRTDAPSGRAVILMGLGFMAVDLFVALPLGLAVFFGGGGVDLSASGLVEYMGVAIRAFWWLLLVTFPIFFFVAAGYGFRAAKKAGQSQK